MKKRNLVLVLFLVLVLSLSLFAVACDEQPSETTAGTTAESTESGNTESGGTESGGTESGGTESSGTESGGTESGGTESGGTESGGAESNTDPSGGDKLPEADSTLTIKQALALAELLENGKYTEGKYYITGTVKTVFNKKQGNITISDNEGNTLKLYSTCNEDGTVKYTDMSEKPVEGDTVKVYGVIGLVNGVIQVKDGWIVEFDSDTTEATGNTTTETTESGGDTGNTTEAPAGSEDNGWGTETEVDNGVVYPFDPDEQTEKQEEETEPVSTSCHARYEYNAGYHWTPACDRTDGMHKNPIKQGKESIHNLYCTVEDEGDVLVYSYTCKVCGYMTSRMEVSYDAALYLDPATLSEASHNFNDAYIDAASMVTVDGFAAARYIGDGVGNRVTVFEDSGNSIATGKYMVIRIKANSGRGQFRVAISSVQSYADHMWREDCVYVNVAGIGSGWSTVIIDVSKLVEETEDGETIDRLGYTVASDGNYYLCSAQIYVDGMEEGDYFDLGYVAFCETLEQAKAVSAGDNVVYYYDDLMASDRPTSHEGTVCDHTYEINETHHDSEPCSICHDDGGEVTHKYTLSMEKNSDGKIVRYGVSCVCGYKPTDRVVTEDINFYTAPTEMSISNWWHGSTHGNAYVEEENIYQRLYLTGDRPNHKGATIAVTSGGDITNFVPISGGSGNYFVFRIRTHDVGVLALKLASKNTYDETKTVPDGYPNQHNWTQYNDKWVTVVVDLNYLDSINGATAYSVNDPDVKYITAGFQYIGVGALEDTYIDVAYFAICDTLAEVKQVTQESDVMYTAWANTSPMNMINLDTGKITCEEGKCSPKTLPSADRKTYQTVCGMCGDVLATKTFTEDINYYSVPGQFYNNWATGGLNAAGSPTGTIVNENGMFYSHITVKEGGSFITSNGTADYVRGYDNNFQIYGGTGNYVVFKARTYGFAQLGPLLNDKQKGDWGDGKRSRRSGASDIGDGTWRVYVIDVAAMKNDYYVANNEDVTHILAGLMVSGVTESDAYIDLAYFAICDNWDEIAEIASGEEKVYLTSWTGSAPLIQATPNGQCIGEHSAPKFDMADGVAKYVCAVCGETMRTVETPEGANFYSVAGQQWNIWASGGLSGEKVPTGSLEIENGVIYNHITMKNGASFEFINVSEPSDKTSSTVENVLTGGTGRFIVFRIRFESDKTDNLALVLYDGQTSGYDQDTHRLWAGLGNSEDKNIATGEWVTYVMDMEATEYSWYTENQVDVTKASFGLNIGSSSYTGDRYIDVQYFAVCDDWSEVSAVVGSETVKYTKWSDTSVDKVGTVDEVRDDQAE